MPPLVGFSGLAGAGKSTAARIISAETGASRVRFAEPLKAMLRALGLTPDEVDGDRKEVPSLLLGGRTPRHAMQTLGTEWGRDLVDPELWLRAWCRAVDAILSSDGAPKPAGLLIVTDDVRFPNEAAAIRERGGLIVRVDRPRLSDAGGAHPSESQEIEPDLVVPNDGSVEDLAACLARHLLP